MGKAIDIAGTGLDNNASGAVEQRITNARITSSAGALRSSLQVAGFTSQSAWAFGAEQNVTSVTVSLDSAGLAVNTQGIGSLAVGRAAIYRQSGSASSTDPTEIVAWTLTNFIFVASDDDAMLFWFKGTLRCLDATSGATATVRLRRGTTTAGTEIIRFTVTVPAGRDGEHTVTSAFAVFDIDVNAAAGVAPGYQTYVITLQMTGGGAQASRHSKFPRSWAWPNRDEPLGARGRGRVGDGDAEPGRAAAGCGGGRAVPGELAMAAGECCVLRHAGDHFEVPAMIGRCGGCSARAASLPTASRSITRRCVRRAPWWPAISIRRCSCRSPPLLECVLPGLEDLPGAPGLRYRTMTCLDLDAAAALAVDANIYLAQCPDGGCSPPRRMRGCSSRAASTGRIPGKWSWSSRAGRSNSNSSPRRRGRIRSASRRISRERPHWFWREAEAPVIRAMRGAGIRSLRSFARADRPDWIAALKRNYGAVEVARLPKTVHLEYPLDAHGGSLHRLAGASHGGAGWQWTGPRVLVNERPRRRSPGSWRNSSASGAWVTPRCRTCAILSDNGRSTGPPLLLGFVDGVLTDVHTLPGAHGRARQRRHPHARPRSRADTHSGSSARAHALVPARRV